MDKEAKGESAPAPSGSSDADEGDYQPSQEEIAASLKRADVSLSIRLRPYTDTFAAYRRCSYRHGRGAPRTRQPSLARPRENLEKIRPQEMHSVIIR